MHQNNLVMQLIQQMRERSVGLGVMGLHSFFQQKMIPLESVMSKVWNKKIFENIQKQVDKASKELSRRKRSLS